MRALATHKLPAAHLLPPHWSPGSPSTNQKLFPNRLPLLLTSATGPKPPQNPLSCCTWTALSLQLLPSLSCSLPSTAISVSGGSHPEVSFKQPAFSGCSQSSSILRAAARSSSRVQLAGSTSNFARHTSKALLSVSPKAISESNMAEAEPAAAAVAAAAATNTPAVEDAAIAVEATAVQGSVRQLVAALVRESLKKTFPSLSDLQPLVAPCANPKFGDYQCNNAMGIWAKIKGTEAAGDFKNPNSIGQALMRNLPASPLVEKTSIAGPGFINIVLKKEFLEERVESLFSAAGIAAWAPSLNISTAVVDFSSPNIAKEMHVGHLRSTIIGDSIARMLEYCQVAVLRRNHVGDWGTQFGMLIEFLFEQFPNWEDIGEQAIGDLQTFYKAAKKKFDEDPEFKDKAQKAVVKLQGGEAAYRAAWTKICDISRREFALVYERLNVQLEERGESFYNEFIPSAVERLREAGLVQESEGAQCIFLESYKVPLIVVKSDGGFNYASTDFACLWYRLNVEKADWVIYVTDVGQSQHFDMVFQSAKKAGWLSHYNPKLSAGSATAPLPRVSHVGFGLVLGEDGKRFRTRSSEVVRLVDLLDEAVQRSKQALVERGREGEWSEAEIDSAAAALGYGAVKYADLKNNRVTNYTFDYDQMLDMKGNTAVYLLYAHARICSIIRKSGKDINQVVKTARLQLNHPSERALALDLVRFSEIVEASLEDLLPNTLCEYLYNLSGSFTTFYTSCQVVGSEEEESRLVLSEATAVVMRKCFHLLGLTPLYRL